jgi:hypothetical protein
MKGILARVSASLGQYLQPSANHYPGREYITPSVFEEYGSAGLGMGFPAVVSAPFVRSSFNAAEMQRSLSYQISDIRRQNKEKTIKIKLPYAFVLCWDCLTGNSLCRTSLKALAAETA